MTERSSTENAKSRAQRPRWRKKRWWFPLLLLAFLVWLDGPGWRWIGAMVAEHYLSKAGFTGDVTLMGRITSGSIGAAEISLTRNGGITLESENGFQIAYKISELFSGNIRSINIDELDVLVDLSAPEMSGDGDEEESTPITGTLTNIRSRLVPIDIHVKDLSVSVVNGDSNVFSIGPTRFSHESGSDSFSFYLGESQFRDEVSLASQDVTIDWSESGLRLDHIKWIAGIEIDNLKVGYNEEKFTALSADLVVNESNFEIRTDFSNGSIKQTGNQLDIGKLADRLGIVMLARVSMSDLEVDLAGLEKGLDSINGKASGLVDYFAFEGWDAEGVNLGLTLDKEELSLALKGILLDVPIDLSLDASIDRIAGIENMFKLNGSLKEVVANLKYQSSGLTIRSDLDRLSLIQQTGSLDLVRIMRELGLASIPDLSISELKVDANGLQGGMKTLGGDVTGVIDKFSYEDWNAEMLETQVKLSGDSLDLKINGTALGSPLVLHSNARLERNEGIKLLHLDYEANVADLGPAWRKLIQTLKAKKGKEGSTDEASNSLEHLKAEIDDEFDSLVLVSTKPEDEIPDPQNGEGNEAGSPDKETMSLPDGTNARITGSIDFTDGKPEVVESKVELKINEVDSPLKIDATLADKEIAFKLDIPGLIASGSYDPVTKSYNGIATATKFDPSELDAWLKPWGIDLPDRMFGTFKWEGSGNLADEDNNIEAKHDGKFGLESLTWQRIIGEPHIEASGRLSYRWPDFVDADSLRLSHGEQKLDARVLLDDKQLNLKEITWHHADELLFNAKGYLPVPDGLMNWRAILQSDKSMELTAESKPLTLNRLNPFLPTGLQFTPASRAHVNLKLSNTPADPVINAHFEASDVGVLSYPDIPLLSVEMDATGKDKTLKVEGEMIVAGYPPAKLTAVTNWEPRMWAEDPETAKEAKLDASLTMNGVQVEQLSMLLPEARRVEGILNVDLKVGGTLGKPEPSGEVTLKAGRYESSNPSLPRIKDLNATIGVTDNQVKIDNFQGTISGGSLNIGGVILLKDWKPVNLDMSIKGESLPAWRDERMIVRINADLGLKGEWDSATLSGNIGVLDSLYYQDIEIIPTGVPVNKPVEPQLPRVSPPKPSELTAAIPAPFSNWALDLGIKTIDPFLIKGNLADGSMVINVKVGGTAGKPRPSGAATVSNTKISLPFSTLNILRGEVTLRPDQPFNPALEVLGESKISPYDVRLDIYGSLNSPKLLLSSSPPLPGSEIMTLLATGTTTEGLVDPSAASARAIQLLVEELRKGRLGNFRALGPLFHALDRIDFHVGEEHRYSSKKYNSVTLVLDDKWMVRAGVSEEGDTRTSVIYHWRFW